MEPNELSENGLAYGFLRGITRRELADLERKTAQDNIEDKKDRDAEALHRDEQKDRGERLRNVKKIV